MTATSSQPSSPQLSRICLVACTSKGTVAYSHFCCMAVTLALRPAEQDRDQVPGDSAWSPAPLLDGSAPEPPAPREGVSAIRASAIAGSGISGSGISGSGITGSGIAPSATGDAGMGATGGVARPPACPIAPAPGAN